MLGAIIGSFIGAVTLRWPQGRSIVVGPWGEIIGLLDHDEPGVLVADLDLATALEVRAAIPALKNACAFVGP